MLNKLERENDQFIKFPDLLELHEEILDLGFGEVLREAGERHLTPVKSMRLAEHAWLASVLDLLRIENRSLATFERDAMDAAESDFIQADRLHVESSADRVRRGWAERATLARNDDPLATAQIARQASLKQRRRMLPLRDLFDRTEGVLKAVKPCWVMSPLVVAQLLPPRSCFDVVVFDEASQILPADAACSLLRGKQAIVAGDPHQLPPTTFFAQGADIDDAEEETDDDSEEADIDLEKVAKAREMALVQGQESVLDVLGALLPPPYGTRVLSWHYRSKDERLITFSNAQEDLYDWSMVTFPGALRGECLEHIYVPFEAGAPVVKASSDAEVQRVVALVIEHARIRPEESLGVIALGVPHVNRITDALRLAQADSPELVELMDEGVEEAFFVKNLERVQGDERDAIILTVGYGKTADGRMRYNFGPINQEGGQRRLNVAVTRARRRMTVVSSFTAGEMDPERTRSMGARMLRDFLLYAESGGTNLGLRAREKPPLNPFERDVQAQLDAKGIPLIPQYGSSGYWIDFAAMHPEPRGEPVLALEADGVMYHASPTARDRDRLRQEHLERLGWTFHRIWSTSWFKSRDEEVARAVEAYRRAVESSESTSSEETKEAEEDVIPEWVPPPNTASMERSGRLNVRRKGSIAEYSPRELRTVVRWIQSDGRLYTDDEIISEVMRAFGFARRGARIVAAIEAAIKAERRSKGRTELISP